MITKDKKASPDIKVKTGAVYSGLSYQHGVLNQDEYHEIDILPVYDLPDIDLNDYDILIFPRGTDQEIAYSQRDRIRQFLDTGKTVISFGEVTEEWLPGCHWAGVVPEDDGLLVIKDQHPVLENLEPEDLFWHKGSTGWCCHGHFADMKDVEILVTNSLGDPIMYIDRKSTKGIIIAASQLDAICHTFHGIAGARILLDNILRWAKTETQKMKETGKQVKMTRSGALYSGVKWQHDLFTSEKYHSLIDDIVPIRTLPELTLAEYDVIIVPRESNQEMLLKGKDNIINFLNNGGTLVSFGEVTLPWLPDCIWENRNPDFRYDSNTCQVSKGDLVTDPYRILNTEHPLLKNLTVEDLQWHFHGVFHAPVTAEVLLSYGDKGDLIYVDTKRFKGSILATTLDPDVHAGYGVVKKTQKFLDNVLIWASANK